MSPTSKAVAQLWPIIWRIAGSMSRRSRGYWSQAELASWGYDGAVGGLRTYDPSYGRSIEDHCARRIKGAMLDGMSSRQWHFLPRAPRKMWHAATARDAATATVDGLDYANAILDWLPDRHAWILGAYYVDGLTQEEIGSRIGLTGSAVAHAMKRSLNTLRQHLAEGTWQR